MDKDRAKCMEFEAWILKLDPSAHDCRLKIAGLRRQMDQACDAGEISLPQWRAFLIGWLRFRPGALRQASWLADRFWEARASRMKLRILVIEDNDINMDLMIFVLNAIGLAVIPALNGPVGLAIAKAEMPDLIICDIQMPHLDGYSVLSALKSDPTLARIPVIAVTAMAMLGDGERLLARGFDGYISKPVEFDQLKAQLARHLPGWR